MSALKSFTLIEALLTMGIVSMIFIGMAMLIPQGMKKEAVSETADNIVTFLQIARRNSMNSEGGVRWGICKVGGEIYVYANNCDASGRKQSFTISNGASVSGLNETSFTKIRGEPDPYGNLSDIVISSTNYAKHISVTRLGGISVTVD